MLLRRTRYCSVNRRQVLLCVIANLTETQTAFGCAEHFGIQNKGECVVESYMVAPLCVLNCCLPLHPNIPRIKKILIFSPI